MTEHAMVQQHTLVRRQIVPAALQRVFPFFASPENLPLITPPALAFRVVTPPPVVMRQGRVIDYTLRLAGIPQRWRSLITLYEPPVCFVDEQLQGPYACWRHTHRFQSCAQGTVIEDDIVYALPAGLPRPFADMLHALYVRPSLEGIFDYRSAFYADFFGGGPAVAERAPAAANVVTKTHSWETQS